MARVSDYEHTMRIGRVEDLMLQGYSRIKIVAICSAEDLTDSEATVGIWIKQVRDRWAAEDAEMRPAYKDLWRQRLDRQYCDAYRASVDEDGKPDKTIAGAMARSECTKIAKLAMALDGLAAPVVVRTDGAVDPAAMAPAERDREIRELLERREQSMRAKAVASTGNGGN